MLVASPATISPRLPPELVSLVFEFSIWSDPYVPFKTLRDKLPDDEGAGAVNGSSTSEDYDPDFRTTIGLVCKAWKRIRDSTPSLWTRVDVVYGAHQPTNTDTLKWLSARSGALPIDVTLTLASSGDSGMPPELEPLLTFPAFRGRGSAYTMDSLNRVLTALQHHIPRWRSLKIGARTRAEAYSALLQFRQPASWLVDLRISAPELGHTIKSLGPPLRARFDVVRNASHTPSNLLAATPSKMPPLFNGKTPRLQHVSLRVFAEPIDVPFMHNLKSIHLSDGWATILSFILLLRQNCTTLEELTITTVDFRHKLVHVPSSPSRSPSAVEDSALDRVCLPALRVLRLEVPRSTMSCILRTITAPSLTHVDLRRTEEAYEHWASDEPDIVTSSDTPTTEDILQLLSDMRAKKLLPPLGSFSLLYGSVWESSPQFKEENTDQALIRFLRDDGSSLDTLTIQNYSRYPSTLLDALTNSIPVLCPELKHVRLTQCEGEGSRVVRKFVESRVPSTSTSETAPSVSQGPLQSLRIEAEIGRIVCSTEDLDWIAARVPSFHVEQTGRGGGTHALFAWLRRRDLPTTPDYGDDDDAGGPWHRFGVESDSEEEI